MSILRATRTILAPLALALVLSACATHPVTVHEDRAFDANSLKTFAWIPAEHAPKSQVGIPEPFTDVRVRRAVESELVAKGYKLVAADQADFWIGYIRFVRMQRERVDFGSYRDDEVGGSRSYWYKRDTLYLDIVSPTSKRVIWRGMTECVVRDESADKKREKMRLHVRLILERFPMRPEVEVPEQPRKGIKTE